MNLDRNRSEKPNKRRARWRHWGFPIAAVALPLIALVILEIGLRITGVAPQSDSAWVELHQLKPLFVLDESNQTWEIPPSRFNFFRPASFPATKSDRTRRVFVLGGSTVQGRPWETETAFSTWLRLRLSSADPGHSYEVINCGGVSYASYRVDKILDEILSHRPDAVVLYTGHNEFLEERTYAQTRASHAGNRFADKVAEHVHLVRWTADWFRQSGSRSEAKSTLTPMKSEVDARLDHINGLDAYHRDPPWRDAVHRHFQETLEQMVMKCNAAAVPLVLCEPASDLVNTPPFKTEPKVELATEDPNELRVLLKEDPAAAGVHYRLGRLLHDSGDAAGAAKHLTAARDHDVCPLRATTTIIDSVRRVCNEHQVTLVPTIALLDQRDFDGKRVPDGIPDPELFVDHVHPTIAGHQRIAEAISLEFARLGWGDQDDVASARYDESVAKHLSTLGEDYFARGKQRLRGLRRWASGRAASLGTDE